MKNTNCRFSDAYIIRNVEAPSSKQTLLVDLGENLEALWEGRPIWLKCSLVCVEGLKGGTVMRHYRFTRYGKRKWKSIIISNALFCWFSVVWSPWKSFEISSKYCSKKYRIVPFLMSSIGFFNLQNSIIVKTRILCRELD